MQYLELIERRYTGQMTPTELADFEKSLKTNPILAEEWAGFQTIAGAMSALENSNIEREVAQSRAALEEEGFFADIERQVEAELAAERAATSVATPAVPQLANADVAMTATRGGREAVAADEVGVPAMEVVKNNLWRRWAVAAGLAVLIVAGWLISQQSGREEQLAELEKQELSRLGLADVARGISANDTFGLIERHIINGQLPNAQQLLAQFKGEKDERYYYIKGYFHYEKREYVLAENALNKVIYEALFPSTKWEAQLLKARCLIAQNKYDEAKAALQGLINTQPEKAWENDFKTIKESAEKFLSAI